MAHKLCSEIASSPRSEYVSDGVQKLPSLLITIVEQVVVPRSRSVAEASLNLGKPALARVVLVLVHTEW